jgi:parallel beta-helix repeat protein
MKMTALTLCLLLLLSASTLMLAEYSLVSGSNSVESQPSNADYEVLTIYLRSDGSVEGTDLIERNGNVYTFKGDIGVFNQTISANTYLGGIVVERDNIVIDGAGYNLTGSGLYGSINPFGDPPIKIHTPGIDTTARRHVTIKNLTIQDFRYGIMLQRSANITVLSCEILRNHNGVDVYNSEQLTLINCKIESTWFSGVYMQNATRCLINNNTFANNKYGIHGGYGSYDGVMYHNNDYNVVFSNQFIGNSYAIQMGASSYNIFSNNVMNGSHWREGIHWSPYEGFGLYGEGVGNIVCGNYISGVNVAINIWSGKDNLFYMNNIANSSFGVKLDGGVNNTFYRNNFVDNGNDVTSKYPDEIVTGSSVFWDKDSVGNYWSKRFRP